MIILGDIAAGLLARSVGDNSLQQNTEMRTVGSLCSFHNMVEFKRPEAFGGELNRFVTTLCKKFPEFPDAPTLQKVRNRA